jgi:hypothetical protein
MSTPHTLEATARRDGKWWFIEIPELDTVGQARRFGEVHDVAVEVAALYLNVPEDDVHVTVRVHASDEAARLWEDAERIEAESRAAQERAAQLRREAVRRARNDEYTYEATAAAFGISRARVQQLEKDTARPARVAS